ncbi:ABC transporter [Methanocella sp. CWC-04]|uniref:ABC transporter n=1 Tax=Methanooceanicella nereidis TaxID=2052831 RepID=A0AAP2RAG6_9EURY|nr:ABC transporter permease [Methanocella sp. CWC-04]MCD1293884.1 ABC transporter [Methanocella sp. CWC-04]
MNYIKIIRSFGLGDLLNVVRDPLLKWMIAMPFMIAILLRFLVPELTAWAAPMIDLVPYYPMIMAIVVVFVPAMYGVCIGFLLLDERDEGMLTALKVTPVSLSSYLVYRITAPMLLSFVSTLIAYPLAGLTGIDPLILIVVALVASFEAPFFALVLACFAENKVQGFAIQKMMGSLLMIPMIAYLLDPKWEFVFYIIPTFWPVKAFWVGTINGPNFWLYVLGAIVFHLILIGLLLKRFDKVMHKVS